MLKDVDSVIVTPGVGDTPLFFSKEGWKLITQFKTFIFAQHNRVLVSGIQQGDASFYLGALGTVALGSMVYMMKQKLSGRDIDYSWNNLVKEGIDRGGMIGWLSEPLNTVENVSGGRFGLGAMFAVRRRYPDSKAAMPLVLCWVRHSISVVMLQRWRMGYSTGNLIASKPTRFVKCYHFRTCGRYHRY